MKNFHKLLTLCFLSLVLAGCDDAKDAVTTEIKEKSNPLSGQMDALKKAKNLEAEMKKSVQDRLNAIDSQK